MQKAVKLMYVGAAVSTVSLIVSVILPLANIAASKAALKKDHPSLTASPGQPGFNLVIAVAIISGAVGACCGCGWRGPTARAGTGPGSPRACSGLATIDLFSVLNAPTVLGLIFPVAVAGRPRRDDLAVAPGVDGVLQAASSS